MVTFALNFDTTDSANPIQRKKHLIVTAKSELLRKTQIINWVELKTELEIEKSGVFGNNSIEKVSGLLGKMGNKVLLVTGKNSERATALSNKFSADIEVSVFKIYPFLLKNIEIIESDK